MPLNTHLVVDGSFLHLINCARSLYSTCLLKSIVFIDTLVPSCHHFLLGEVLHLKLHPLSASDSLHEENLQSVLDQLNSIFRVQVVDLVLEINDGEVFDLLSIDLEQ